MTAKTYTREQIETALARSRDLTGELRADGISERDDDFLTIFTDVLTALLDGGGAVRALDDVLNAGADQADAAWDTGKFTTRAQWVRSWWSGWE